MLKRLAPLLRSNSRYPTWNRMMELAGIAAYAVFAALLAGELVRGFTVDTAYWLLPVALAAFVGADLTSGFVHCAADNFGSPSTPIFGVAFIRPFRDHHGDPLDITRHDFVETNGNSCIVNLLVLIPTYLLIAQAHSSLGAGLELLGLFVLFFTFAIVMTNQVHKWAHMPEPPRSVAHLQRFGLILSPHNHAVHHTAPFDRHYCITTGWMNGIVERLGFFAWLVRMASPLRTEEREGN